jgi:hypothetical protein
MTELSSSARIMRGFSRIGIGATALAAVSTILVTISDYRSTTQWAGLPVANPSDQFDPDKFLAEAALKSGALTVLTGLGVTGAACLAIFGFFRGFGWVVAGFAGD